MTFTVHCVVAAAISGLFATSAMVGQGTLADYQRAPHPSGGSRQMPAHHYNGLHVFRLYLPEVWTPMERLHMRPLLPCPQ